MSLRDCYVRLKLYVIFQCLRWKETKQVTLFVFSTVWYNVLISDFACIMLIVDLIEYECRLKTGRTVSAYNICINTK